MKSSMGAINSTSHERHPLTGYLITMVVFKLVCFLLGVSGNLLVIIHNVLRYEKTPATYLSVNLAICDLLTCLTIYPTRVAKAMDMLISPINEQNETFFCRVNYFSGCFSVSLSVLALLAVNYDRYLLIRRPLKYPMLVTKRKVYGIIAATWLASLIYLLLSVTYVETSRRHSNTSGCSPRREALSILLILYIYIPIILILLFNLKTWRIVQAQRRSIARNSVRDSSAQNVNITTRIAKELKAVKTLAMIMGVLVFCFTPFATMVIFDILHFDPGLPPSLYELFADLVGVNSVCNPLIYSIRHKEYRQAIRKCFSAVCG